MRDFWNVFKFEIRYRLSRPATYAYFGALFAVAFVLLGGGFTPAAETVFHNSPYVIAQLQVTISLFGVLLASAVMGVPIYRDLEHKTGTFMFSYPLSKFAYFMGRFWGSFVVLLGITSGVMLGIFVGSIIGGTTGWTDADRYGPHELMNYLHPWLTMVLPNMWIAGTLFFALIIFTRNIKSIYSGGIILFIAYLLSNFLAQDIENKNLVQLLDPFALNAFNYETRYLTPFEQNSFIAPMQGNLLWNRVIWSLAGLCFFLAAYWRFSFSYFFQERLKRTEKSAGEEIAPVATIGKVQTVFSGKYQWMSLLALTKIEVNNVLKDVYFRSILLGGLVFLIIDFWIGSTIYSVSNFPVTSFLMEFKGFDYNLFVFIIIVFFTGESIHRNQASGYAVISDTFPVKDSVLLSSKFFAMATVTFILAFIPIPIGMLVQTLKGYFNYQLPVYLVDSFLITYPDYLQMVMLVFAVHMLFNNKFAGHAASIAIWVVLGVVMDLANVNFNLFLYSFKPSYLWSDMNGLGHFSGSLLWFNIYWSAIGLFLVLFFSIFFIRGTEVSFSSRLNTAKKRLKSPAVGLSLVFLLIGLGSGAYIFQSVVYENGYQTVKEGQKDRAEYEKQLKQYERLPQPKVVSVLLKADLVPEERNAYFNLLLTIVNKTDSPIDSLHMNANDLTEFEVRLDGQSLPYRFPLTFGRRKFDVLNKYNQKEWYKILALPKSMQPGDTLQLEVSASLIKKGFPNSGYGRDLVYNGTFTSAFLPSFGYNPSIELTSDEIRKKHGLEKKDTDLPPHDDPFGLTNLLFSQDADFVNFEAVVSTHPDQIAVVPGYLQKEWEENGRRYFHYIQDTPIQYFFSVVSGEFDVLLDEAVLPDGQKVTIEIYHHREHKYNLDRFLAAYKDGLVYFSEKYSPFQFRQMRILEFPRYAGFAQSFPNTVPFSESFGWVADFSDPNDFDYVYFVTAHELAHQWWGHQVPPNYTRGSNLISEALAEYSALILTEKAYGRDNMKRFLKQELDSYLSGRSNESKKENVFINADRGYIWYQKGALVLYALRDYIGDAAMDAALKNFVDEFGLKETPPFAGSSDLLRHLTHHTPDSMHYFLDDTWNKITLYENKAQEAKAENLGDNEYLVTLTVNSRKVYADSLGRESPADYEGDYIDIGIFAREDKDENGRNRTNPLYLQKHKIVAGETILKIKVKGEAPVKAGIDPYNKLIDRIPEDNIVNVSID
ncbi:ABC transporter permease/M1 family aminopeptidase [Mongoliibacter ruber]|uniref:Peptidase M1-like protein n=1 Tax=Mongoliibacter ruber TaxID=1750599 RepID=A0A2T0WVJ3_9BACT|nr:M1 family aminopeptidase [Mongoliibacter ruber]PRY90700.1 peptidase M1-like protein [Mongoliibacter ruber]